MELDEKIIHHKMTTESDLLLLKRLQKCFLLLESYVGQWETALLDCAGVVTSTANLCEQQNNCKQVDVQTLPMAKMFPDVQERLLYKIASEIEAKLKILQEKLYLLKETHDQFSKQNEQSIKVYKKYSVELDVYKMTESKPTWPSMSEMLEMLSNADSLLFDLYHCKIHCLEQLASGSDPDCDNLPQSWSAHDTEIIQTIKDHLCHVSFFLKEKL